LILSTCRRSSKVLEFLNKMKISKHIHSCLLIEDQGKTVLIDPGQYSFEAKALDLGSITKLDALLITHEHPDHFYLPAIKEILAKFPKTPIISNPSVVELLKKENITASSLGNEFVEIEEAPHEHVFGVAQMPKNVLFRVFGKLTHPGDSEHYDLKTEVLALPVQAPWTATTAAVERAVKLKPKVIIPIHDWHWNEEAREGLYGRFVNYFKENGIDFKPLKTGEVVEV
jgi:L-ascorbate metabolism protein UlaG (beta-lactamase superfamily)